MVVAPAGQLAECRAKAPPVGSGAKPKPTNDFVKKLESISAALVAAVFVDFPKNRRNFLHKNKHDIVRRVQFLTRRRPMRSLSSRGSRHHCPMEVGSARRI